MASTAKPVLVQKIQVASSTSELVLVQNIASTAELVLVQQIARTAGPVLGKGDPGS